MSIDELINENDESLEFQLSELRKRKDFYNPQFWIKNKKLLNKYQNERAKELVEKHHWPKKVAKQIARFIHPPSKKTTITDYAIGYFAGGLPKRYLEPISEFRNKDILTYTKTSIITDGILLGISAFLIYGMHAEHKSETITQIYNFLNDAGPKILIYGNALARTIQLYTRTKAYRKGNHTWSPASIINPFLPEVITFTPLIGYDQYKKIKENKIDESGKNRKLIDVVTNKKYLNSIME